MPRHERFALFALLAFSTVAFLPIFGEITVLGVALFGWLMAALLLGSPAILLALLLAERSPAGERERERDAEPSETGETPPGP